MQELFRKTSVYRAISSAREETFSQAVLVVFPDGKYLRQLLKECAKAFFGAEDGSRVAELIEKESFSDCRFYPAEDKKLTADDCAESIEESLLRPVEGDKKLFILDGFHLATPLVQNKLLKILEEPPAGVHFLLGAETEFPVLPTVLSRVKKFAIAPFSEEDIEWALHRKYPMQDISEAAAGSGGIFSVGESLLVGGGEEFRLAEQFLSLNHLEAFCRENGERKNKREFFAALKACLRDMLFFGTGQRKYTKLKGDSIETLAAEYPTGAVIAALELVSEAEKQITFNANFASCLYALGLGMKEEKIKWQRLS